MGISTDADLYYGIQLDEGIEFPWHADEDNYFDEWEEYYCHKFGIEHPEEEYSQDNPMVMDKYKKYWGAKNNFIKNSSCMIGMHCSYDYPMYYIAIRKSQRHAKRGYPCKIDNELTINPNWDLQLQDFCKIMGLPYEPPSWWLSSMWG